MSDKGKLVVISGPSGVGKSSIVREVLARTGAVFSVSATTRRPRPGETDGREYHFVDRPTFEAMIARGELLEWAEVFGDYYGTPAGPVREAIDAGRTVILEIDIQGGLQVHEKHPQAVFVLILPPSEAELRRRLAGRGTEANGSLQQRLAKAAEEIRTARDSGVYTHLVVNDDLERAIQEVVEIVTRESRQP
ncbi:MAG: guanylate kinase [Planctomycetales bacterium 4484_123]|nr:MAG: guanylate kinase [Planctomycetales bacterium 4484_123]